MRGARPSPLAAAVAVLVSTSCPKAPGPPEPLPPNQVPVARIVLPQVWPADVPMELDGSLSADPDDEPLAYRVNWGDGTPSAHSDAPLLSHTYDAPGSYAVEFAVQDGVGAEALVQVQAVIIDAEEPETCTCDVDCFEDGVCTAQGCLEFRSSVGEEDPPADAFGDTLSCPG